MATEMLILRSVREMQDFARSAKAGGKRIGFVPTMGYLHPAHTSLMRLARQRADVLVVSLYVNPAQFGPNEDFQSYPRDFARDEALCQAAEVDVLFYPSDAAMYSPDSSTIVEHTRLSTVIEGASRPGHFRGVATVVAKLFNIVLPDVAVFGEKDVQQLCIIRRMTADLNFPVEIVAGPIVREPDGLAMSSRNAYLDPASRSEAVCLSQGLQAARAAFEAGERSVDALCAVVARRVAQAPQAVLDYVTVVDEASFALVERITAPARILLVVRFGRTRLLDNLLLIPVGLESPPRVCYTSDRSGNFRGRTP